MHRRRLMAYYYAIAIIVASVLELIENITLLAAPE